jgi:UDP-N-acetylglucosamine 4-epimerase
MFTTENDCLNQVYNVAFGENSTLNELFYGIRLNLSKFDQKIESIDCIYGDFRKGDIPHSLASIQKAKHLLKYNPTYSLSDGLKETVKWYWENKELK